MSKLETRSDLLAGIIGILIIIVAIIVQFFEHIILSHSIGEFFLIFIQRVAISTIGIGTLYLAFRNKHLHADAGYLIFFGSVICFFTIVITAIAWD